jgi:hypothetical protein
MKTFTTFFITAILSGSITAQQMNGPSVPAPDKQHRSNKSLEKNYFEAKHTEKLNRSVTVTPTHERIGPASTVGNGANSGAIGLYVDPLFVDSTVTTNFGGGASSVQTMKAGGVFDPTSTYYYPNETLPSWENYTIDTIWIAGEYHIKNSGRDTLQLEVSFGPPASAWYKALSIPTPAQKWSLPINTTSAVAGNKTFSTAPTTNSVKIKRLFKTADTVGQTKTITFFPFVPVTPIAVPAGSIVGIEYTFVNKNTHTANQNYFTYPTNNSTMNSFLSYELGDTATTGHNWFYDSTSYGTSSALFPKERYGAMPTAQAFLNGVMLPMTDAGYLWEISLTHTVLVTEADNLSRYGVALYQNTPNPFGASSEVHYELGTSSEVVFSIYDVTGRLVLENRLGKMDAGRHAVSMNASEFTKGVYFYNIKANGASLSKKMIITE